MLEVLPRFGGVIVLLLLLEIVFRTPLRVTDSMRVLVPEIVDAGMDVVTPRVAP